MPAVIQFLCTMGLGSVLLSVLVACSTSAITHNRELPPSRIMESSDLQDVLSIAAQLALEVGKEHVLVVYDLDNTLLAMEQDLGSDQWYYWQKELQAADRCDPRVVTDRLAAQGALLYASAMRLTQEDGPQIVQSIQDQGFKSIILTSRGADFAAMSFRELRRNDFDFRDSALGAAGGPALEFKPKDDSRTTRYEDGVYLTAGQHKGEMLLALLDKTATALPRAIVMADDKEENLQDVLDAFADTSTSIQALRYNREDTRVAAFDGAQTVAEWEQVEPALLQLQAVFGPDNFHLPEPTIPQGCPTGQP